jgi:hypothetical protein
MVRDVLVTVPWKDCVPVPVPAVVMMDDRDKN